MRFKLFVAALVAMGMLSVESQAQCGPFRKHCGNTVGCGTVSSGCGNTVGCGTVSNFAAPCGSGYAVPTYSVPQTAPFVQPLPKAPSSVGGYPTGTTQPYYGELRPGMWIMLDNGQMAQITSVGNSTPTTPTPTTTPPTIRKLPESQPTPDTRPKAPKNNG